MSIRTASAADRRLWRDVASLVAASPEEFRAAGKKFDVDYSYPVQRRLHLLDIARQRRKLPQDHKLRRRGPELPRQVDDDLKRPAFRLNLAFIAAMEHFHGAAEPALLTIDAARRIVLLTWLLTDPEADNTQLTRFQHQCPWDQPSGTEDGTIDMMCRAMLFESTLRQSPNRWRKALRWALKALGGVLANGGW
jgi:hypothetical protein